RRGPAPTPRPCSGAAHACGGAAAATIARRTAPRRTVSEETETATGWLSPERLESVRGELPVVYVPAVPVRLDERGEVTHVGLLLRVASDGTISRTVISGRVLYRERIRDALMRNLEK